jgi:ferredoxin
MILNRTLYHRVSSIQSYWFSRTVKKLFGEKSYKAFNLHKTEWPQKLYFYSPRLKTVPRFTGNKELLASWQTSRLCETLCPTNAITVTAEAIIIDDRGCVTCGLCVELAPPGLLEMSGDKPQETPRV